MALQNIKVIELAGLAPAPFCGMLLSDFGASVIRVDKIKYNTEFDCLANGKRSISINIKDPAGAKILRKLCKQSDVLIEPFRKGVMEKLGLGPTVLLEDNPRLIYARLTGYGQCGPMSARAGHDINFVALTGLLSLFGREDENPSPPINLVADFAGGGLICALGILLALHERNISGKGQVVDSAMVNGAAYLGSWLYRSQMLPGIWGQPRGRNLLDGGSHFYETYKTKDGKFMAVGPIEPQFYAELIQGLDLTEEEAPQYGNFPLKKLFADKFLEKTQEEWRRIFDTTDACVAPVLTLEEASAHPHNVEQGTFTRSSEGLSPNPAPKLSRTPGKTGFLKKPPIRGEHTREVLENLGMGAEEIGKLEREGVVECYVMPKL